MSTVNNTIIGAAEREFQQQAAVGNSELDKMAFLQLLVAQLQHQDPLNPMDDTAFVTQLAQFTQLETLNNISSSMDTVIEGMARQENLSAASFLGKHVESYGDQVSVDDNGNRTELYYYLGEDIVSGSVNIMDSTGNIIRTFNIGAKTAGGPYSLGWDGYDYKGDKAPTGVYLVGMSCLNSEGSPVIIASQVSGKVDRVFYEEGTQYLGLEDGRVINLSYVTAIREPDQSDVAIVPPTTAEQLAEVNKEITALETTITGYDTELAELQEIIDDPLSSDLNRESATTRKEKVEADKKAAEDDLKLLQTERDKLQKKLDEENGTNP